MHAFAEDYRLAVVQLNFHMKRILIFAMGVVLWASMQSHAAQTAQATLFCLSVRFYQATTIDGQLTYDLSTLDPTVTINGELAPTFDAPSHFSSYYVYDTIFDEGIDGFIELDVPMDEDANNNGFADFFESSQAISGATTTGDYDVSPMDKGTLKAIWNRAAGSKDGTCTIQLKSATFGQLADLVHAFEILEYTGPLNYTPDTNKVSGTLKLTQTGDTNNQLAGPIEYTKSPTNRFDEFTLRHAVWTNAFDQTFQISNDIDPFLRDLSLKTNYYGYVDIDDGNPGTSNPDYLTWVLSIDDVNDSNGNGIPDFSDDPGGSVRRPTVLLSLSNTNVTFTISSTVGRTVEIQESSSLSQTNWARVTSFAPTNDPQVVPLPRPAEGTKFWRLQVL
jgi:hypothetical protein